MLQLLLCYRTIAKVSVSGSGFMTELLQDIDRQYLPGNKRLYTTLTELRDHHDMLPRSAAMVGGEYKGFVEYESFAFDLGYLKVDPCSSAGADHHDKLQEG